MINEILTFILAVAGLVFALWFMVLRLISWRINNLTVTIPVYNDDTALFDEVYAVYSLCDFCKIKKRCTIALVDYGASVEFCNTITEFYKNYDFIKLIKPDDLIREWRT